GLAGIRADPDHPGYELVLLRPGIESGVAAAKAELRSPRGAIVSDWSVADGHLAWRVVVPAGIRAVLRVPAVGAAEHAPVTVDGKSPAAAGLRELGGDNGEFAFAGEYRIAR
ncbi:MAG: hypothetical protein FJ265_09560, partial [Planctomycetes bacterium]|nr:hypothetical protein [Planctomycetota bacterium]